MNKCFNWSTEEKLVLNNKDKRVFRKYRSDSIFALEASLKKLEMFDNILRDCVTDACRSCKHGREAGRRKKKHVSFLEGDSEKHLSSHSRQSSDRY